MTEFFQTLIQLIDFAIVPVIFAVAFALFVWGIFNYFFLGAGNEEKRKEGRSFVIYGIVGFVIMFSLWGIVSLLTDSLGFGNENRPRLPFEEETGAQGQTTGNSLFPRGDEVCTVHANGGDNCGSGFICNPSTLRCEARIDNGGTIGTPCDPENPVCPAGQVCDPTPCDGNCPQCVVDI